MQNRVILDNLVEILLEKETLNKEEIAEIFKGAVAKPNRPAWTGSPLRKPSTIPPVSMKPKKEKVVVIAESKEVKPRKKKSPGA